MEEQRDRGKRRAAAAVIWRERRVRAGGEEIGEKKGKERERDILKNVRSFLKKEPNAKNHEIANACGCSEEEAKDAKEFLESLL